MTLNIKKLFIGGLIATMALPAVAYSMSHMDGESGYGCKKDKHSYEMKHDGTDEGYTKDHAFLVDHLTQMLTDPELTEEQKSTIEHHLIMIDKMEKRYKGHGKYHDKDYTNH